MPFHIILGHNSQNLVLGVGPYAPHQESIMRADQKKLAESFKHMDWIALELHPRDEGRILAALSSDNPPAFMLPNGEPLARRRYGRH